MKVDLLILQLAIIFLPGIIWASLDANYAAKIRPSDSQFILRGFMFGLVVYAVEFVVYTIFGVPFHVADFAEASAHDVVSRAILWEVLWALLISVLLSILWLYTSRYKLLTRGLQFIGATKKFGDEDVWDYTFNSTNIEVEYIHLRDFENECVYAGWVNTFSETDKVRELVMLDVIVYGLDGAELYKTPRLYLARDPGSIHIEFPYLSTDQQGASASDKATISGDGRLQQGKADL